MEVKPGHYRIKEFHFHVYWFQNNQKQSKEAETFRSKIVDQVKSGDFMVICHGIDSQIIPQLASSVPTVNLNPVGPHPCGSFEIWCPAEHVSKMLSFAMLNRGSLSILVHPLARNEIEDHTKHQMWLGPSFPLDTSNLNPDGGDEPQYPELGLGYSKSD